MKKIFLIILSFALLLGGCGSKDEKEIKEKKVVVSLGMKPKSLDPNMYYEIPALEVTEQIFNTLFKLDENGNILPELAESYEYTTPTELVIKLKQGVKFHNGETMTADDVVFSIERMLDKPASRVMVEDILTAEAIDSNTVKLTLKKSSAPLLFGLTHPLTAILNKKDTEAKGGIISIEPVGTGPFKFISWGDGEKIELETFDDYFEGRAKIDKLTFRAIVENSSRLAALETGEIDIAYYIAPIDTITIEKNPKLYLVSEPTTSTEFMTVNNTKYPFTNKEFRLALNYALDKQSMVDSVFMGRGKTAKSIIGSNIFGYSDEIKGFPYDPEKARELIKASGVENPHFKLNINDNTVRQQLAQIVQANMKEVGVEVEIETLEWGTYLQKTALGDYEAFLGGWVSGTADADIILFPLLHSSNHGGAGNRSYYTNKDLDVIIEKGRETLDPEQRKTYYKEAQELLQEETPLIVMLNSNENIGINKRIKGFLYSSTMMHNLYNLEIVEE